MKPTIRQAAILGAVVVLFALPSAAFAAIPTSGPLAQFSAPLEPLNVSSVPAGYVFGTGTWSGTVNLAASRVSFDVSVSGGTPFTTYLVAITFYNATTGALSRSYGVLTTDAGGNGAFSGNSQIFRGTAQIGITLSDASHFSPPLPVLGADPRIGSGAPT